VKEGHEVLKELLKEGIRVVPPTREFCEGRCYPCSVSHVKAAIVFPLASGFTDKLHGEDVIEIVAPVKLKDALSLADGDEIVITVERPWKT
jgi:CTP-dependent riboflavin kinase